MKLYKIHQKQYALSKWSFKCIQYVKAQRICINFTTNLLKYKILNVICKFFLVIKSDTFKAFHAPHYIILNFFSIHFYCLRCKIYRKKKDRYIHILRNITSPQESHLTMTILVPSKIRITFSYVYYYLATVVFIKVNTSSFKNVLTLSN